MARTPPEADKDDIYGQYLFAQDRKDTPIPKEQDTPEEYQLKHAYKNHFIGDMEYLSNIMPLLHKLKSEGKYSKILNVPSKYKKAYRYMVVKEDALSSIIGQSIDIKSSITPVITNGGTFNWANDRTYKSQSSWTVNKSAIEKIIKDWGALYFFPRTEKEKIEAERRGAHQLFLVILVANIDQNDFYFNPDMFAELKGRYNYQREVIAYKNVTCSKTAYISNHAAINVYKMLNKRKIESSNMTPGIYDKIDTALNLNLVKKLNSVL